MQRLARSVFVCLIGMCGMAWGAAPSSYLGRGESKVVDGDLVEARTKALDAAILDALEHGASALLSPTELEQAASSLILVRSPRRYVRSYRVLHESPYDKTYLVQVTASVALARLRQALRALNPQSERADSSAGERPSVYVRLETSDLSSPVRSSLQNNIQAALSNAGFACKSADSDVSTSNLKTDVLLKFSVVSHLSTAVRGLEYPGVLTKVSAELVHLTAFPHRPKFQSSAHDAARTLEEAKRLSSSTAIQSVLDEAVARLGKVWPQPQSTQSSVSLVFHRLRNFGDVRLICDALMRRHPSLSSCRPSRFSRLQTALTVDSNRFSKSICRDLIKNPPTQEMTFAELPANDNTCAFAATYSTES